MNSNSINKMCPLKAIICRGNDLNLEFFKRFIELTDEQYTAMNVELLKYLESQCGKVSEDTYTTRHLVEFLENYKIQ